MRKIKIVRSVLAGLMFALIMMVTGPAETAVADHADGDDTYIKVCVSINSQGPMEVFSGLHPTGVIIIGDRCNTFYNGDGSVRVDPDPELGGDVGSTWWGFIGHGYDYCSSGTNGEAWINPPDSAGLDGVRYNSDASGC